jgi:hypothetical protein
LKSLREAASAMDMELVYGLIPKDGSLDKLIDRKARELATKIVMHSSNTVEQEGKKHLQAHIKSAVEDNALSIKIEMPKILWN